MNGKQIISALVSGILLIAAFGCEEYNAPPQVQLVLPETGAFSVDDDIRLVFSEEIRTESLSVQIWPNARGTRRLPLTEVQPLSAVCKFANAPCGDVNIEIDNNNTEASLILEGELARPGASMVLEVSAGLSDIAGNKTGVSRYFGIQYRAGGGVNTEDVEFDNGVYILSGSVSQPVPLDLVLVTDVKVLADGRVSLAAAKGNVSDDAPSKTTRDPDYVTVDTGNLGWTMYAEGQVYLEDDGTRFLETEPFEVALAVGGIGVELKTVRVFGEITRDGDGNDTIDGTLSYEKLVFNGMDFAGGSAGLVWSYIGPEKAPEGHPQLCGNLCGTVTGTCNPPQEFPHNDFCNEEAD